MCYGLDAKSLQYMAKQSEPIEITRERLDKAIATLLMIKGLRAAVEAAIFEANIKIIEPPKQSTQCGFEIIQDLMNDMPAAVIQNQNNRQHLPA